MTKHQLPLFEDPTILPTGKHHVSYSEISDWMDCSYRHKLKHIDKIDLDKPSIHTEYGKAIHDSLEDFILTRKLPDPLKAEGVFREAMSKLEAEHQVSYPATEIDSFASSIAPLLEAVPTFLDTEFPGWIGHAAEMALMESIEGQTNKKFKGFIDTIIKVPRTRKLPIKRSPETSQVSHKTIMRLSELKAMAGETGEKKQQEVMASELSSNSTDSSGSDGLVHDYYVLDWKTTNFGWPPDKKRDFQKQLQLILYKHFFCKIQNLPLEQVKCGFVLLKRTPRKSDNSRVELVTVSVGPKTQEKALKVVHDMINQIQVGRVIKNRASCRYCAYNGTPHCT